MGEVIINGLVALGMALGIGIVFWLAYMAVKVIRKGLKLMRKGLKYDCIIEDKDCEISYLNDRLDKSGKIHRDYREYDEKREKRLLRVQKDLGLLRCEEFKGKIEFDELLTIDTLISENKDLKKRDNWRKESYRALNKELVETIEFNRILLGKNKELEKRDSWRVTDIEELKEENEKLIYKSDFFSMQIDGLKEEIEGYKVDVQVSKRHYTTVLGMNEELKEVIGNLKAELRFDNSRNVCGCSYCNKKR